MNVQTWQLAVYCSVAIALVCADSSFAAERLTIGQLQKYHASYQMRSVTVVGTVEEMQAFPPMRVLTKSCFTLYGRGKFVLVDDTGSLQVESLGSCFPAAQHLPHDGDQVKVTMKIHVDVPEGQATHVIKGITQEIIIVK
jgi:hypothetical protein